jgi:hypothetical protein
MVEPELFSKGRISRCRLRFVLVLLVMQLAGALLSTSAWASMGHGFVGSFGPEGPGASATFANPQGVAVDQINGYVYVYDAGEGGSVYKFNLAGEPVNFTALGTNSITGVGGGGSDENEIAVDDSNGVASGDIYVANNSEVVVYSKAGERLGSLSGGEACGVAVGADGNVYVGFFSSAQVNEYVPAANPVTTSDYLTSLNDLSAVCNIALSPQGAVYVDSYSAGPVMKYEPSQFSLAEPIGTLFAEHGATLAADQVTGDVYVDENNIVTQYGNSGNVVGTFGQRGAGALEGSYGIAVDDTNEDAFVSNEGRVEIFAPGEGPEAPQTDPVTNITGMAATFNGTLNPGKSAKVGYYFQYNVGSTCEGGATSPVSEGLEGQSLPVSFAASELEGNTLYAVCAVAVNPFGAISGSPVSFTTMREKPIVTTEAGTSNGSTEATLSAEIRPGNLDTKYHFEYGTEAPAYGNGAPIPDADAGTSPTTVSQTIDGLEPGKTYHYRVVATNSVGTSEGPDQTFITPPLEPVVTLESATNITKTTATLSGSINPEGYETAYRFRYAALNPNCILQDFKFGECGTDVPIPDGDVGNGSRAVPVMVTLTGLSPATTYAYVLYATRGGSVVSGSPYPEFTTLPLAPGITPQPVADLSMTSAVGVGLINPQGGDTTYHFEYGPTASYGAVSPNVDAGSGRENLLVSGVLVDLQPATEYHYRIVAVNAGGPTDGPDETFLTYAPYATAPEALTAGTSALAATSVTLDGVLNPEGAETLYSFEYGTTTSYGSVMPVPYASAGSASTERGVSQSVTGLQPGTTYHYRLVANNAGGTNYGDDQTVTTTGTSPGGGEALPVVFPNFSSLSLAPTPPAQPGPSPVRTVLTKAQELARALKACLADRDHRKRTSCKASARRKYGPKPKTGKKPSKK